MMDSDDLMPEGSIARILLENKLHPDVDLFHYQEAITFFRADGTPDRKMDENANRFPSQQPTKFDFY